jgi:translin
MSGSRRSAEPRGPAPLLPEPALAAIERHLGRREARRADLAERARRLRRLAQAMMAHLHDGRTVDREVTQVRRELQELVWWVGRNAPADAALAHDAFQEAVEACLLFALHRDERLPTPGDLGVEPEAYLSGMADAIGEVRRLVLHDLSEGDVDVAERRLLTLEALFRILMRFETTRAILALKPKQDTARSLLERTRGEVTMARMLHRARLPRRAEDDP